ncbi:MAG: response regulator [Myxococcota bacterium]
MTTAPRVLVVDDERFFREAVRDALTGLSVRCELAETGEEALKLSEDPGIEAVVLDVRLPGTSGLEVLRSLRERRPALRVIVLSAHTDQDLVLEALRLGAADYLAKPIHDEELRLAVTRAVEGTRLATRYASLCRRLDRLVFGGDELRDRADEKAPQERLAHVAEPAAELLAEVLSAARTSLLVHEGDVLRVAGMVGGELGAEEVSPAHRVESVAGLAFGADRVLRFEDIDRDERLAGRASRGRYATRAALLAPLAVAGEPFGVLCAADPRDGGVFGDEDESMLRLFADRLGEILGRGPLAEPAASEEPETEEPPSADPEETLRAELLRAACEAMTQEVEPEAVLGAALEPIVQELGGTAAIYVLDARSGELAVQAARDAGGRVDRERLPRDRGLTAVVLQTGRLVAAEEPAADARFDAAVDTPEDGVAGPLLVLPLLIRGKALGLARIHPEDAGGASPRTPEQQAGALAAALRNALLYRSLIESIDDVARARREAGTRSG